jgi:hypothetical protein
MASIRPPRTAAPALTVGRRDVLRFLLAAILACVGGQSLAHLSTLERSLHDSGLVGTTATWIAVAWSLGALAAAIALLMRASARPGAFAAVLLALAITIFAIVAWIRDTPVSCSCTTATLQRGTRHHAEAVVGDALLLALGGITFVTVGTRSGRSTRLGE